MNPQNHEPDEGVLSADELVATWGTDREVLLPILEALQKRHGFLSPATMRRVAEKTGLGPAAVYGVATFYPRLRLAPAGRHIIRVCVGTACHVKGADLVVDAFRRHLGLADGCDTDDDGLFTLETAACLGCCMLAPVVAVDDLLYGPVPPRDVSRVLNDFLASREATDRPSSGEPSQEEGVGKVRTCLCSSCAAAKSSEVFGEIVRCIEDFHLPAIASESSCTGASFAAPMVSIETTDGTNFRYGRLGRGDVEAVLLRHFRPRSAARRIRAVVNRFLDRLLDEEPLPPPTRFAPDVRDPLLDDYEKGQVRMATEGAGGLHPLDLDGYMAAGGFDALRMMRDQLSPEEVISRVAASGLRGRGGGGYPTAEKWAAALASDGEACVVVNGDEGDPGAFMDRLLLESFPLRVLEGAVIAAEAVGAKEIIFYIRAEYPLALSRITRAFALCRERGLFAGAGHPIEVRAVVGGGAFVCGEETALIAALEGRRGTPRFRPPFPTTRGFRGRPTLVNNVETLALVPWILRHGPSAFRAVGTKGSPGTKTFALAGKVVRGGLVEVPLGIGLRRIIEEIGGGVADGRTLKAVQVGGPSGGLLPAAMLDTAVDYEALAGAGAMMGSGGLVVLDDTDCCVEVARYFLAFTQCESCGQCTLCRVGTLRMLTILQGLCEGRGRVEDIEELTVLAGEVAAGSLCGLGRTAPNPVLSTLTHFRHEYEAHVEGRCPAGRCRALIRYTITDDCIGCTRCVQHCPVDAIAPRPFEKHDIDPNLCIRCGTCRTVCPADAVLVE